jgi:hypothetical protein
MKVKRRVKSSEGASNCTLPMETNQRRYSKKRFEAKPGIATKLQCKCQNQVFGLELSKRQGPHSIFQGFLTQQQKLELNPAYLIVMNQLSIHRKCKG